MAEYFDRYDKFKINGSVKTVPGIYLDPKPTDKTVVYKQGETRLDRLSQEFYNNPFHGFLILAANPQYGGLEFYIPDGEIIRVPFPFQASIEEYNDKINEYRRLYGI